ITSQDSTRQLFTTNIPYTFTNEQKRYEGKLTFSLNSNHRVQGAYTKIIQNAVNNNQFNVMDTTSLFTSKQPQDLLALNYNGVLSPTLFFEGRYARRHLILSGLGSPYQAIINSTMGRDLIGRTRSWASDVCRGLR